MTNAYIIDPKDQSKVESSLKGQEDDAPSDLAENEYYALSSSAKDKPLPESPRTKEPIGGSTLQDQAKTKSIPKDTTTTGTTTGTNTNTDEDVNPEEGKPLDKLTGAGPRPVEELAKENGGNAAAAASNDAVSSSQEDNKSKPGQQQKLPEDNSQQNDGEKWEATEDEYVKTTGLAADGGNFDAAKPGAGAEADRMFFFSNFIFL